MGKKYSTKPGHVNYFEVPKPLWKRVKHLFPKVPRKPGRGRPPLPNRLVLNAIWYVLWTGCQWQALPSAAFGVSSSAAHVRFQKWQELGIFEQVMAEMVRFNDKKRKIRWKWQAIDGKNCPAPLGGADTGRNPTDRGKRGSKLPILVDKRGHR